MAISRSTVQLPGDPSDYNLSLFAGTLTCDGQGGFVFPFDPANDFDPSQAPGSETINVPKDPTWIGRGIHPDAHAMAFALTHDGSAFDGKSVWIGCDGGVFQSSNGGMLGSFEARNLGLADIELTFSRTAPCERRRFVLRMPGQRHRSAASEGRSGRRPWKETAASARSTWCRISTDSTEYPAQSPPVC